MLPSATLAAPTDSLGSVLDMVAGGGPLMIPIAASSVIALAFCVERSIRLRDAELGSLRYGRQIVGAFEEEGRQAALALCDGPSRPLGRILGAGLRRLDAPPLEREKAVEDAGAREVRRLSSKLRPLVVIAMLAPLLGLLGTVWGMIEAFSSIALQDGLGRPELLASGISQALVTTAAGLVVAIPTQAAAYWFKSRIERFVQRTEDVYAELSERLVLAPLADEVHA